MLNSGLSIHIPLCSSVLSYCYHGGFIMYIFTSLPSTAYTALRSTGCSLSFFNLLNIRFQVLSLNNIPGSSPVEMGPQPLGQGLLIQQEPGELEHQLEHLCQLLHRPPASPVNGTWAMPVPLQGIPSTVMETKFSRAATRDPKLAFLHTLNALNSLPWSS